MKNELQHADSRALYEPFADVLLTQSRDDAFRWITGVLATQAGSLRSSNAELVAYSGSGLAIDWFEANVGSPVAGSWGVGAAMAGTPWPRISAWLDAGGPRMLMALDALRAYRKPAPNMSPLAQIAAPTLPQAPTASELEGALSRVLEQHNTPRIQAAVEAIRRYSGEILDRDRRGVEVHDLPRLYATPESFPAAGPILRKHEEILSGMQQAMDDVLGKQRD